MIDRNPDQLVEIPMQAIRRTRVRFIDKLRALRFDSKELEI